MINYNFVIKPLDRNLRLKLNPVLKDLENL